MSTDWEEKLPTRALGFKDEFADSAGLTHTGRVKLDSIPEIVFDCLPILVPCGWMNWIEICLFHSLLNRIFATKKNIERLRNCPDIRLLVSHDIDIIIKWDQSWCQP